MDIQFVCEKCGQPLVVDAADTGTVVQCPKCLKPITVTAAAVTNINAGSTPAPPSTTATKKCHFCAEEILTEATKCQHCGELLNVTSNTQLQPPPIFPQEEVWYGAKDSVVEIRLGSGALLRIKAVKLYNERELMELNTHKATAMHLLQGGGDGSISGVIGSPSWVLIAGTLQNLAMTHVANRNAAKGAAMATKIIAQEQQLLEQAVFFPVGRINRMDHPSPETWRVQLTSNSFVHNGDEFILVKDMDDSICSIRWNSVEYYSYQIKAL